MTPPEYTAMRPYLPTPAASRARSTAASNSRSATRTPPCSSRTRTAPDLLAQVEEAYRAPSLYDEAAAPAGAPRPAGAGRPHWSATGRSPTNRATASSRPGSWCTATRTKYWDLYQLGEKLTDLEDAFRLWRFRHVTTVERVIGFKRGTGGTGGVSYLRKMLDVVLFPEIWKLRTDL
jgi:tryptophan 2,3-dioxygenase